MDRGLREMIVERMWPVDFALQDLLTEDTPESLDWALQATQELHQALREYRTRNEGGRQDGCQLQ